MSQFFDPFDPNILIFDKLDSTSSEAKKIIDAGNAEHGLIIWAKEQIKGKGRGDKIWHSYNGNLTMSVIIKLTKNFANYSLYPFIIAIAIKEALEKEGVYGLRFKWPNDILLNHKKIAGILLESKIKWSEENFLICGIGLNIANYPKEIKNTTCLEKEKYKIDDIGKILFLIIANIGNHLDKIDQEKYHKSIYDEWLKSAYNLGKEITVIDGNKKIRGVFETIDHGNLILKTADKRHIISTGEVFFKDEHSETGNDNDNIAYLNRDK